MSYMHIDNLYKDQSILAFKECYAMEKIHGTSAHVRFKHGGVSMVDGHIEEPEVSYFAGGEKHERFVELFKDQIELAKLVFRDMGIEDVTVFGEAYGGKCQGMKATYGADLRFVAFEVNIDDMWLAVPQAEEVARRLGFDFVHYKLIPATIEAIDEQRDADSVQAFKNGMGIGNMREGIVLRPPFEVQLNSGRRVIAKHKRAEFCETKQPRDISAEKLKAVEDAKTVADDWVTEERLRHVMDGLVASGQVHEEYTTDLSNLGVVIKAMTADILREGASEIVDSKEVRRMIGHYIAALFKRLVGTTHNLYECIHDDEDKNS